jgi:hypothetical protein
MALNSVNNVKQIRPFLLLVHGSGDPKPVEETEGTLFRHDPALTMPTTFFHKLLRLVSHTSEHR